MYGGGYVIVGMCTFGGTQREGGRGGVAQSGSVVAGNGDWAGKGGVVVEGEKVFEKAESGENAV